MNKFFENSYGDFIFSGQSTSIFDNFLYRLYIRFKLFMKANESNRMQIYRSLNLKEK